jgi:16S rRNA C967 or C1407 C5-methylase (RsmB/RsmF family)
MVTLPEIFVKRMKFILGEDYTRFETAYALPLRRGVRVNTLKWSVEDCLTAFPCALEPSPFSPDSFYLNEPFKAGADPLHHAGGYYMQEPSASSAVTVLCSPVRIFFTEHLPAAISSSPSRTAKGTPSLSA